ncbi:MAG: hypothetical protein Unbinned3338contig1000_9 [Prokaryotic dsDNA virus sp.]|nr:MAG: hypothetical protein Unbinned3338contig1000_9 [Prokaryotic dsDNA virus sp.]
MAKRSLSKLTVQEAQNAALGQAGSIYIDDTAQHTGPYVAVTALEDSIVDKSDCTNIEDTMEDAADFTIPKGVTIFGRFEVMSLASGKVIAYKG